MKTLTFRQALHIVAFLVAALLAKFVDAQEPIYNVYNTVEGKWIARVNGGDIIWFTVDKFMNARETEMNWTVKEGGRSGKVLVYSENRYKVQDFFTEVDIHNYYIKDYNSDFFVTESNGNKVILRKIQGL